MIAEVGKFARGEIVWWKSLNSNRDHHGVVVRQFDDPALGARTIVRSKLGFLEVVTTDRLHHTSASTTVLCGPGALA